MTGSVTRTATAARQKTKEDIGQGARGKRDQSRSLLNDAITPWLTVRIVDGLEIEHRPQDSMQISLGVNLEKGQRLAAPYITKNQQQAGRARSAIFRVRTIIILKSRPY